MANPVNRRILFITYYFPPSSGPGVQRALKFAKYLPEFGWLPTVLTVRPEDAAYPNTDSALLDEIPVQVQVERTKAWDPYALYARLQGKAKSDTVGVGFVGESSMTWKQAFARWVRANVFLPDARAGWVPYATRGANALMKNQTFHAVFTTGPPHSTHLIGRRIAAQHRLPWVADFRDPWTGIDFYKDLPMSVIAKKWDARLEKQVLEQADRVLVVSPDMKRRLQKRVDTDYTVLQNGFDPADFVHDSPALSTTFTLSYIGNLNAARNPEALWKAMASPVLDTTRDSIAVRLVGNVDPMAVATARKYKVDERVTVEPYLAHADAVRAMQASTMLLLIINRVEGAEGIMTGKLYEYIASGRPILGIGPVEGDAAQVLRETEAGQMFDYEDHAGVAGFIEEQYQAWQHGRPKTGADPTRRKRYSRRSQTEQLAHLLSHIS